ncbi:MAG: carboxylating nicotinate-nucleotide diphosphorylase, partial [Bacteroidales bacterium]
MQYENLINKLIDLALEEDIHTGDITTESIIPESSQAIATMTAKADGVISGLDIIKKVFDHFQNNIIWTPFVKD